MSESIPETRVLGRRGEAECARARRSLALGQHADALAAVRRARRLRPAQEAPGLALAEADALCGLLRYREAVAVATRALRRGPPEPDVAARLRLVRGHALWLTGPSSRARGEVRKAARQATAPLTRARILEEQAVHAGKEDDVPAALAALAEAEGIYTRAGATAGQVRVLEKRAAVLRSAGRLEEAIAIQERRIDMAGTLDRADLVALARSDRAALFTALGRWEDARRDLDEAALLFHGRGDVREFTVAEAGRAVVDLATGEFARARATLDRVREMHAERGNTRSLAESLLVLSDLHLACGEAEAAERTAVEALGLFRLVQDGEGVCLSRVARAHALVALGRYSHAVLEGRRACRAAATGRSDLVALALLALGRALLRVDRRAAAPVLERTRDMGRARPALAHAADLGAAIARGDDPAGHAVLEALGGLSAWGDRRLLGYALADVRGVLDRPRAVFVAEGALATLPPVPVLSAAVDAAAVLLSETSPLACWAATMRALASVLPWSRAALVAPPPCGWHLPRGAAEPAPLAADDVARALGREATGPRRIDLGQPPWRHTRPTAAGAAHALVAPVGPAATLCLEFEGEGLPPDDVALALVVEFARLLALRPLEMGDEGGTLAPAPGFPGIVGACPAMKELFQTMERVAASDLVVHVTGETGTGKERVAQALHARSGRTGRFVAVNASSLSDELFESEVFGHVRGAFTGAAADREGQVAAAERGTLFLDEVSDLSPRAQAKLLRFVETREYSRLGETRVRTADIRLVTAANVPLEGRLRMDLVFRLKDVVLALPPLRARGDDLWRLVREFLRHHAPGGHVPALSPAARKRLDSHTWPGNVRELQREIRRALVLSGGQTIGPEHLSLRPAAAMPASRSLRDAVMDCERRHIRAVLADNGGNRARAAGELGLTRQGLVAKMARLGIE